MNAIAVTSIPNNPPNAPVFDFELASGDYARVPLTTISNDGQALVVSGWAYLIDAQGLPKLAPATGAPTATADSTHSIALSGVLAGTHALYDGWVKYMPQSGETLSAANLPAGWTRGSGAPAVPDPAPAYGTGYYDTAAEQGYVWAQGELARVAQGHANALAAQIDTAAKLAALGL